MHILVHSILLVIFNLMLFYFPLTKVFGYEYSAANAVFISFLSGIFAIAIFKSKLPLEILRSLSKRSFLIYFISILLIPLIMAVVHSYFGIACSLKDGFEFYAVITVPSVLIGAALGAFAFIFFKKISYFIFIIIYLLIISITFVELYFNPQIYFFNPVFGYFPGTIYDEAIPVTLKLISYRILNLLYFGLLLLTLYKYNFKVITLTKKFIFFLAVIFPALFLYFSPVFGYSTTFTKLKSELSNHISTEHFEIYFAPGIDSTLMKSIALQHEYYYFRLSDYFDVVPKEKINSYIFYDSNQKKELFGSKNADVAKPWQYSTYTTYDDYDRTLRHEIAHCFTAEFGTGIFKLADWFNPALIEGAAVAGDPFYGENAVDYMAALAYQNDFKVNIVSLFSSFNFFTNVSSLSYIYAGSFAKYLIRNYGIQKFKLLYGSLHFQKIYGNTLSKIEQDYYEYLKTLNLSDTKDKAYYYYGSRSIFYKVCPRYVAEQLHTAWDMFYQGRYESAGSAFNQILKVTNNPSAYTGLAESMFKQTKIDTAISILKDNIEKFKNTSSYYSMEFTLADLSAEANNISYADSLYIEIMRQNPGRVLYYLSHLRLELSLKNVMLKEYLKGSEFDKYVILQKLNGNYYHYCSFPVLIVLSKALKEKYDIFLSQFTKSLTVTDYESSYAAYKLSQYVLEKLDFDKARKLAALSTRFKKDKNFDEVIQSNYEKMLWCFNNAGNVTAKFKTKEN